MKPLLSAVVMVITIVALFAVVAGTITTHPTPGSGRVVSR